jgi:hypothetical protein
VTGDPVASEDHRGHEPTWAPTRSRGRCRVAAAVTSLGGGVTVFAGQRAEGFYVDLGSIFDLGDLRTPRPASSPTG